MPHELQDLSVVKESMIALCRAKCCIVHLKADDMDHVGPTAQHGIKGNIIIYLQRPSEIARKLPPSIEEITSPICILFVGSTPPTDEWICEKVKPLAVCTNKVCQALLWLKAHNHLYRDIEIDKSVLHQLDSTPHLPFHIEHILPSRATDASTSSYDPSASGSNDATHNPEICADDNNIGMSEIPFARCHYLGCQKRGEYVSVGCCSS